MQDKINFRIVENPEKFKETIYQKFLKDYMNTDIRPYELMEKYQFSQIDYSRYISEIYRRTGFKRKRGVQKPIHIDKRENGVYRVSKTINGKTYHCGVYKNKNNAVYVRDKLIQSNWNMHKLNKIRKKAQSTLRDCGSLWKK